MSKKLIYLISKKNNEYEGIKKSSIKECINYCSSKSILGLDIETSANKELKHLSNDIYTGGLDPYLSKVIMLQIGDLNSKFIIDVRDYSKKELQPIIDLLHWNKDIKFVGHNLKFECVHLRHQLGIRLFSVYDTMMAEISLFNGVTKGLSLEALSRKYLNVQDETKINLFNYDNYVDNVPESDSNEFDSTEFDNIVTGFELEDIIQLDKSTRLQFINIGEKPFSLEQLIYGAQDIELPLKIRVCQLKGHDLLGYKFVNTTNINFESAFTQVGGDMEYNGMPFSEEEWRKLYDKNSEIYYYRLNSLNRYIVENYPKYSQLNLFSTEPDCTIDWSSPKQVIGFFRELKICPKEKSKQTKKYEWSVSSKALLPTLPNELVDAYMKDISIKIKDLNTLKLAYLALRKSQMNITTYGLDFLKYKHPVTGRLHPKYRLHLLSSRTATTSPNLLAVPVTHRSAFCTSDTRLCVSDYSSQESRTIASLSNDPLLLDFFNKGHELFKSDFHSYTSSLVEKAKDPNAKIYPKGHELFTKDMALKRQNIKSVNFGLAYGITVISLSKQLNIPLEEAKSLVNSYFETFSDLYTFIETSKADAIDKGYVIFEKSLNAIFLQSNFKETLEKEEKCKSYFFTDKYRNLSIPEREEYKKNLYKNKPYIKQWFTDIGIMKSRLGNRGCNLKIQGTSAKQSKRALIQMRILSVENPYLKWLICLLLHDEAVSEAPSEHSDTVIRLQNKCMIDSAEYFCPNVKFDTGSKVSTVWDH